MLGQALGEGVRVRLEVAVPERERKGGNTEPDLAKSVRLYPLETVNVERLLVVVLGQLDGGTPIGIRRIDALLHLQLGGIRVCGGHMNKRLQSLPSQRQLD